MQQFYSKNEIIQSFECEEYALEKSIALSFLKPCEIVNGVEFFHLDDILTAFENFTNLSQFGTIDSEEVKKRAFDADRWID